MARRDSEDVIEKKESDPVAMAALVLAALVLAGAMVLQVVQLAEYKSGGAEASDVGTALGEFESQVDEVLAFAGGGDADGDGGFDEEDLDGDSDEDEEDSAEAEEEEEEF
jgi:hypothetical protein